MKNNTQLLGLLLASVFAVSASAAVHLDRTRLIFMGKQKSASILVANEMPQPYLLQAWVEGENEEKITWPLLAVPPLQRIDAAQKKFIQVVNVDEAGLLSDRESLFYLNILEVPPQVAEENVLQIAFQSRIKIFYRPQGLVHQGKTPWQQALQLSVEEGALMFKNPTAFHTVIVFLGNGKDQPYPEFSELIMKPYSSVRYQPTKPLKDQVYLSYMDDTGASKPLIYQCAQSQCALVLPQKEQ